jgi:putative transposase
VTKLQNLFAVSARRAQRLVGLSRGTAHYKSKRNDDALRAAMKRIAAERRRFGYKRLAIMLKREGYIHNLKKIYRINREEGLMVKRRRGRKRAIGTRLPLPKSDSLNQIWSLDFLSDALSDGRRFRVLGIMDQCSRECLTLVADTSIDLPPIFRSTRT